jgi:rare lipoprotein A
MANGQFYPDPIVSQQPVQQTGIYVQAGAFLDSRNAGDFARKMEQYGRAQIYPTIVKGRQFYRVRLGPVSTVAEADTLLARIEKSGYGHPVIIVD